MLDPSTFPDLQIVLSGVTAQGTGFSRELLPGTIAVIAFAFWMMRGAPVTPRLEGGFSLLWVVILGFIVWGLFGPDVSHGADAPPEPAGIEETAAPSSAPWWNGADCTGLLAGALLFLAFFLHPPKDEPKKPAKKPEKKPETDPRAELIQTLLNSKKALLVPVLLTLWAPPAHSGQRFADVFTSSDRIAEAEADRARAVAELERIRTDNAIRIEQARADIERQTALLRSAGYEPAERGGGTGAVLIASIISFAVAVLATFLYWVEIRRREAGEAEIRELRYRLTIANHSPAQPEFAGEPRKALVYHWRHPDDER